MEHSFTFVMGYVMRYKGTLHLQHCTVHNTGRPFLFIESRLLHSNSRREGIAAGLERQICHLNGNQPRLHLH
ncbi:hypothetical protein I7I48_08867 [Histoplasma ohiense]|nr:hypothetical protein I7I48_08867 [Histoplasma ohiense (nom. inval.)]